VKQILAKRRNGSETHISTKKATNSTAVNQNFTSIIESVEHSQKPQKKNKFIKRKKANASIDHTKQHKSIFKINSTVNTCNYKTPERSRKVKVLPQFLYL